MILWKILNLIGWIIIGQYVICKNKTETTVSKFDYVAVWVTVVLICFVDLLSELKIL